jgi:hypothetical protein
MPVVQTKRQVPVSNKFHFMALDEDGFDLPSDWCVFRNSNYLLVLLITVIVVQVHENMWSRG